MNIVKTITLLLFLFGIGWFVSFQYDPYKVCRDHPDPAKRKNFYECEPGGFVLQKGTRLERTDDDRFPWEKKGDVIIGTEKPVKKTQAKQPTAAEMDEWECTQEFYSMAPSRWKDLKLEDYCRRRKDLSRQPLPADAPGNYAPNATEEL